MSGFPSNDFKGPEAGSEAWIKECFMLTCGVRFSMSEKIHGADADTTLLDPDPAKIASEIEPDAMALAAVIEHELKAAAPTQ